MQQSFSSLEFSGKKKKKKQTRRERLLSEIDAITPWADLMAAIEPHYPKGEGRGRPPIGLARLLRMYVVQQCLGLSDEGIEDAVYESQAIRSFIGIALARESTPARTASGSSRCATGGWRRTWHSCSRFSASPTC